MPPAPLPENEEQRLKVLKNLDFQAATADQALQALTRCAARLLGMPIAIVSIVEDDRQWFPVSVGLDGVSDTPRTDAFCAYTILGDDLLEVPDATADPRFTDNPLVRGEPYLRFYAGAPLVSEAGTALGGFCVLDRRPRTLTQEQRSLLQELAIAAQSVLTHYIRQADLLKIVTEARDAAQQASQAKSLFLAGISHELRTPLNAVLGYADIIAQEIHGPLGHSRYQEAARYIGQSGHHLLTLISELIDLSRVEAGDTCLQTHPLDLREIVAWCIDTVILQARAKNVVLHAALDGSALPILGDTRACRQIVLNILSNAVKYTPNGGRIIVAPDLDSPQVCGLVVRDTGIGMPQAEVDRLLRPFERMDHSYTREHEGAGLGLSLAKRLIEAHGGAIRIDSDPGIGTTVRLTWPRAVETRAPTGDQADIHRSGDPT